MSVVKSFSVGNGDMFYIKHGCSCFTIIDSCLPEDRSREILGEIWEESREKNIVRFISTHPDEDHIRGLKKLNEVIDIRNFYCVSNRAVEDEKSEDFECYRHLRDSERHFNVNRSCSCKWLNRNDENDGCNYGCSGINFAWPDVCNSDYQNALAKAENENACNNISPIFTYGIENGAAIMWMGDMEREFQEKIMDCVQWPQVDILFAPHHGRDSGRVPKEILERVCPQIIVIGEAPSGYLNYYSGYNTITQNRAGDIAFVCDDGLIDVYSSNENYECELPKRFLRGVWRDRCGFYKGSIRPYGAG